MTQQRITHEQFLRLFLTHERDVLRYVMALIPNVADAQDVVQNTAVALWRKIDDYDPGQPFAAWACRFALIEAKAYARKHHRWRRFLDAAAAERLIARREQIDERLDARREALRECLKKLPDHSRELIDGYYFAEQPVQGIAERTGRSVEAIYKALQRIREQLQRCIDHGPDSEAAET